MGAAAKLAFGQQPTTTVAGVSISPAVTVRVLDQFNNLVSTDTSSITQDPPHGTIVDRLDARTAMLAVPLALLVAYGLLRLSTTLFTELREFLFAKVLQRAMRKIGLQVFRHLHALSMRFHLARQTGGLTRDVERGQRGISSLTSFALLVARRFQPRERGRDARR